MLWRFKSDPLQDKQGQDFITPALVVCTDTDSESLQPCKSVTKTQPALDLHFTSECMELLLKNLNVVTAKTVYATS